MAGTGVARKADEAAGFVIEHLYRCRIGLLVGADGLAGSRESNRHGALRVGIGERVDQRAGD